MPVNRTFIHRKNKAISNTLHRKKNYSGEEFNLRQQKMLQVLLDIFFGKLNVSKWATITKTSKDTALRDIQDLIKKGVLEQEESGGRSTSYRLKNIR